MKALVLLAPGCEEMEAVIVMDVLRRGGVDVVGAGLDPGVLTASRGVKIEPDLPLDALENAKDFDLLVLPGGLPGTEAMLADVRVRDLVLHYATTPGQLLGAICAAPLVLDAHGVLEGKGFTCFPTLRHRIETRGWSPERVVEDGELITSQGPGTAMAFALCLVRRLAGEEAAHSVAEGLLFQNPSE
ncbi:MAG: DJ-1/PfpI family protein [Verrucomicrobia bacterium]|nr:DJ-1/PfpI family protein [Verrucomicrobiota bacterium]MCH8512963.1 DJ-1/PfpI family protein [Kiritimatiellia bacterium]